MSGAARAFGEWFTDVWGDDMADHKAFDREDLADAFASGWEAAMGATWEPAEVPQPHGPWAHPGAPR